MFHQPEIRCLGEDSPHKPSWVRWGRVRWLQFTQTHASFFAGDPGSRWDPTFHLLKPPGKKYLPVVIDSLYNQQGKYNIFLSKWKQHICPSGNFLAAERSDFTEYAAASATAALEISLAKDFLGEFVAAPERYPVGWLVSKETKKNPTVVGLKDTKMKQRPF